MKHGNACGAKRLAGRPWNGDTSSALRGGQRNLTKPISVTYSAEGGEVFLKGRMRENRTYGSVRGFIVDSEYSSGYEFYRQTLESLAQRVEDVKVEVVKDAVLDIIEKGVRKFIRIMLEIYANMKYPFRRRS